MASKRSILVPVVPAVALAAVGLATVWMVRQPVREAHAVPVPADWSVLPAGAREAASDAVESCRAAPLDPVAFTRLGRIYHGNAEPVLAVASYERALELGAADARTPYLLALLYEDWGRTDDAVEMLGVTLQRDDTYAPAWFHLSRTQLDTGDPPTAIAASRRAVELDPSVAAYHAGLGRALRRSGRLDEAVTALRQALAIDPEHPGAHQLMGLTLRARGDDADAEAHLDRISRYSTEVLPDPWLLEAHRHAASVETQLAWVRSYLEVGRLEAALTVLGELAVNNPDHAEVFRRLGETYARGGRSDLAADAYRRAVTLDPFDVSTRRALAESLLLAGDLSGAEREVTQVLTESPADVDALVIRATVHLQRGEVDVAVRQLEAITVQRGDHVAGHYWLGEALMTLERYEQAVVVYRRLLELRPDLTSARRQLEKASRLRSEGAGR